MLVEFSVSNYRSIGERQVLSMVPAQKQRDHMQNVLEQGKYQVLNAAALYGPNASGKSNLLRAMSLMDAMVSQGGRLSSTQLLHFDPFLLRKGFEGHPTEVEIVFLLDGDRYRYGFAYDANAIRKEWLCKKGTGREVTHFLREGDIIDVSSGYHGNKRVVDAAIEATRDNGLFLASSDMLNIPEARKVLQWFKQLYMIDGLNTSYEEIQTVELWEMPKYKEKIKAYLSAMDLNIQSMRVDYPEMGGSRVNSPILSYGRNDGAHTAGDGRFSVMAQHRLYGENGKATDGMVEWKWEERESSGAQKMFQMSGPILWALSVGGVLIIDEIEAKTHPILTLNIIEAFLNPKSNPNGAQLVFATHDTNLLTYAPLRRDQIYFTEKNEWESTEIYSLADFVYFGERNGEFKSEKERPDTDKEKRYLEGRYGAIPVLGAFQEFIREKVWRSAES